MPRKLLIGLAIFFSLAGFGWRILPEVTGWYFRPSHEFDPATLPAAPDYHQREFWSAWSDDQSPAERLPKGIAKVPIEERMADAFFLHPTSYGSTDSWVAPLDDPNANRATDLGPISFQASAFNGCCRVYAPRFRQATWGTYSTEGHLFHQGMDLAYQDARAAFLYFLEVTGDRPIVLGSHSQGSFHMARLIMEEVDNKIVMNRLVGIYAIGHSLPEALVDKLDDIKVCNTPTQISCLVTWDAHEADRSPSSWEEKNTSRFWNGDAYKGFGESSTICVNPITWRTDGKISKKAQHLGSVISQSKALAIGSPLPDPIGGTVSARCAQGLERNWLWINGDRHPALRSPFPWSLFGRNLHGMDYGLFWADIRENAMNRTSNFIAERKENTDLTQSSATLFRSIKSKSISTPSPGS